MFHAVFLITIGSLLLANNFNYLSWGIWQNLVSYWPILIVFAGIDVIFGKSNLGRIIAGIINILIFLMIVSKVIGLNLPFQNPVPLPKNNLIAPESFFTERKNKVDIN